MAIEEFVNSVEQVAPGIRDSLNPGANSETIRLFQEKVGFDLPDQLREVWLAFNGQKADAPPTMVGYNFCSCDGSMKVWESHSAIDPDARKFNPVEGDERIDDRIQQGVTWDNGWVPFAAYDSSMLIVDCNPTERGTLGQVFELSSEDTPGPVIAASLDDLFMDASRKIASGEFETVLGGLLIEFQRLD